MDTYTITGQQDGVSSEDYQYAANATMNGGRKSIEETKKDLEQISINSNNDSSQEPTT